jgi:hypothetical protein
VRSRQICVLKKEQVWASAVRTNVSALAPFPAALPLSRSLHSKLCIDVFLCPFVHLSSQCSVWTIIEPSTIACATGKNAVVFELTQQGQEREAQMRGWSLAGHIAYTAYDDSDSRMESQKRVCAGPRRCHVICADGVSS